MSVVVRFGGVEAVNVRVVDDGHIECDTPPGTGVVDVVVETDGGEATLAGAYTYAAPPPVPPQVVGIVPAQGPPAGGTDVTIYGHGFEELQAR